MNRIRRIHAAVATLVGAPLALAATSPAFTQPWPQPDSQARPHAENEPRASVSGRHLTGAKDRG